MKIKLKQLGEDFHLEATNEEGNTVQLDSAPGHGGKGMGMRPMQLLLVALGGCSAIDILTILKKQREVGSSLEIEVDGNREKAGDYSLFKTILIHFKFSGSVDYQKAERAVKLSLEKYCSVAKTLEPTARITYQITINPYPTAN